MKLAALVLIGLSGTVLADPQSDAAARLNQQGVELMASGKFGEAAAKFKDAAAHVPDPKYFFNACTAEYQQGRFIDALSACNAVARNGASAELEANAAKLIQRIKDDAKAQKIEIEGAERAAKANQEGVDLMAGGKFAEAVPKFLDAIARDPVAKYDFNLCTADYMIGRFGEALAACNAVAKASPSADLQAKTQKLIAKIRQDAHAQKIQLE